MDFVQKLTRSYLKQWEIQKRLKVHTTKLKHAYKHKYMRTDTTPVFHVWCKWKAATLNFGKSLRQSGTSA